MIREPIIFDAFSRQQSDWIYQRELLKKKAKLEVNQYVEEYTDLSIAHFKEAYAFLFQRHESLRTIFTLIDGSVKQKIQPFSAEKFYLSFQDISHFDTLNQEKAIEQAQDKIAMDFADLTSGTLAQGFLFQRSAGRYTFLFACHHINSDAFSLRIFSDELEMVYEALKEGLSIPFPALEMQLREYLVQEHEQLNGRYGDKLYGYWNKILSEYLSPVEHARLYNNFSQSNTGLVPAKEAVASAKDTMDLATWLKYTTVFEDKQALSEAADAHGVSLPSILLSCFMLSVHKCFSLEKMLMICTVNGRNKSATRQIIGNLACNVFIKGQINPDVTLKDVLMPIYLGFLQSCRYPIFDFRRIGPFDLRRKCEFYYNYLEFDKNKDISTSIDNYLHKPHKGYYSFAHTVCEYKNGFAFRYCYHHEIYTRDIIERIGHVHLLILQEFIDNPNATIKSLNRFF